MTAAYDRVPTRMLIGGARVEAVAGETFDSVNPYTGEVWIQIPRGRAEDADAAVGAARQALEGPWGQMTGTDRARLIRKLADLLGERAEGLAQIETTDNGKLLREMRPMVAGLVEWYHYYAGWADKLEGRSIPNDKANFLVYTRREPIGVVAAILPWNSPLSVLAFKVAPALAAGCTVVAKPAEQTSASTLAFAELFEEAGFPPGVFNVVTGFGPEVGHALATHPGVDKVAFTGSTATGVSIAKDAVGHLGSVSLELGGKSPQLVFGDADLDAAAIGAVAGIFAATGQTCVAGSRLLVQRDVADELTQRIVERAATIRLGDPFDPDSEMGPVAFPEQLDKILDYIGYGVDAGATVLCGGKRSNEERLGKGLFIEPTVLTGVDNSMRVAREEIFGPVLCVLPFDTEEEAIQIANDSPYGLAAGVWTDDIRRGHRVSHRLQAGTIWVNAYRTLSFAVPFGGYKASGLGRENGHEAIDAYTQTKAIWVELSGSTRDPFRAG